ncbi:MAG: pyridoxal phosphate-dependent aminotransferase [Planctomycetota bacterium]
MISQRVRTITPSATLSLNARLQEMRAQGTEIINLSVGEPDFETPKFIRDVAHDAMESGWTRYTPTSGHPEAREAVCRHVLRTRNVEVKPEQVILSSGVKHSLSQTLLSLVNPGDEVMIGAPYWVSYPELIRLADGIPVVVETRIEDGFRLTREALEAQLTPRTMGIILNEPGNPTGVVSSASEVLEIIEFARDNDLWVISDEIYEAMVHEGKLNSPFSIDPERVSYISGLSKSFAMTGWRLGWSVSEPERANAIGRLQSHNAANPCSISQATVAAALDGMDHPELQEMYAAFRQRKDLVVEKLNAMDGVQFVAPKGAFYVFVDVSNFLGNDKRVTDANQFCLGLLEEMGVAAVPGDAFGSPGCLRLSYARPNTEIAEALDRLDQFLQKTSETS